MSISIIIRAYKTFELRNLIHNLQLNKEINNEIIVVCNVNNYKITEVKNLKLIIENSNRFQAKITGIKNATFDKILFLDSDQIPGEKLLNELESREEDMLIIPERSVNNNFTAKCLDDWRYRNERYAMINPNPYIPVIPRYYKKGYLINAVNKLPPQIYNIIDHEDSVLYYMVFKETQNIGFTREYIYNYDPSFLQLIYKAFLYGRYNKNFQSIYKSYLTQYQSNYNSTELLNEINILIDKLNKNTLNIKELGIGKGYIMQLLRGIAYIIGKLL